jgi:hypothetical protein
MSINLGRSWQFIIFSSAILLGLGFFSYRFYFNYHLFRSINFPIPECDLRYGSCVSKLPTGESVELNIKPIHMPALTSVRLEVKTNQIPARKVIVNFKGAEMDMGEFSYHLSHKKDGLYYTQTILPTCIHDHMIWHAVVQIQTPQKNYEAPFVFTNLRPEQA